MTCSAETTLAALNEKYGFVTSLLVARDGRLLARAGNAEHPAAIDPFNLFFRDAETLANTFDVVEQGSPRSLVQGSRQVIVFKLQPDIVLGVVKDDARAPLEMHRLTTQLQAELPALFAGIDSLSPEWSR